MACCFFSRVDGLMNSENAANSKEFYVSAANAAEKINEFIAKGLFIRIVSHLDADGLTAASILAKSLYRSDALFRIRIVKQLDEGLVEVLAAEGVSPLIFTDLGSGNLDLLKSRLSSNDIVVLDHHQPLGDAFPTLTQVNPHNHGFNGGQEISGSGVAYTVAKEMNASNVDLASLAVVGALGDAQDRNPKRELVSLNQTIVADGVDAGCLSVENDLTFYGRETRPLHKALAYTTNPFLPGLSGEEDKCLGFLVNLGIELQNGGRWRALNDLNADEKQKIFSEIAKLLSSKRLPNTVTLSLIGAVYTLIQEDRGTYLRDAREYSSLLNACGRMDKAGLGVSIGVGDRDRALEEAQDVFTNYKKTLAEYMDWITTTPNVIDERDNIYLLNGRETIKESMLGTVTTIVISSNILVKDKPLIALTSADNGMLKISGRATPANIEKKLNLGTILQEASSEFGGIGGGHDVAAGAQLPEKFADDFIQLVDQLVGSSLNEEA
jgi:single-stranded-DNA-specific exonuclease